MIAYNHQSLDNLLIKEEATFALRHKLISKEEADAIENAYPANFYMPNLFIRIGLFLLTAVIILMCFGLLCLITMTGSEKSLGILAFIFTLSIYGALEFLIHEKQHYTSGIDDALLWLCLGFAVAAANLLFSSIPPLGQAVLIFTLSFYFLLRFGNVIMGALAYVSFLGMVFYSAILLGDMAKTAMPFLLMAISYAVYWCMSKYRNNNRLRHYKSCCTFIEIIALITLYAAGNYFVVREVSNSMFQLNLKEGESFPGGWFFWITTVLIPAAYLFRGIQKKDVILLRTGLILVAGIVFTIRYYYHLAPLEITFTISGIFMILIAYIITKYLTPVKFGFTHAEPNDPELTGLLQLESLVVAQTFHQAPANEPEKRFDFGGGSGGGAGATDNF